MGDNKNEIIKERLKYYRCMHQRIDVQEERLQSLRDKMQSPSSPVISEMPKGGSVEDKIVRQLEDLEILEEKIDKLKEEEKKEKEYLGMIIDKLENPYEQVILQMRYLDRWNWQEICRNIYGRNADYSENEEVYGRKVYRLHKNGILNLEKQSKNKNNLN